MASISTAALYIGESASSAKVNEDIVIPLAPPNANFRHAKKGVFFAFS
ncbi:hypothetical protein ACFSR7_01995 [Cohnella sp. GCM10020058]